MKRHRIAILTSSFPPQSGGIAAAHFNLFHRFSDKHEVCAFTYRDSVKQKTENVVHGTAFPGMQRTARMMLRKLLRQSCFSDSLEHCDAIADTGANILSLNRPLQRFRPDFILCPDHYVPALLLKKPPSSKLIWLARNNYLRFVNQPLVPPRNVQDLLLAHRVERRAVRKADAVVSPSAYMTSVYRDTLEHEVPMWVAKNFVNTQQLELIEPSDLRNQLGLGPDSILAYVPSGGIPMKGLRYLYEIARTLKKLPAPSGLFVPGYVPDDVRWELDQLQPHVRCHLPGPVPYAQNLAHVAGCDLTVSPTLIENLSNALVESIMLGVPVTTFDTGGNREIVVNDKTGCVVPFADIDALTNSIREMASTVDRLNSLKAACRTHRHEVISAAEIDEVWSSVFATLQGLEDRSPELESSASYSS